MDKILGTNCAQAVGTTGRNTVDSLPQLPHFCVQLATSTSSVCTNRGSFAAVVRAEHTEMCTGQNGILSQVKRCLSPVSTEPTITTITYI